jgi:hypothetical protein
MMGSVMMDRVEKKATGFPKSVAIEEDMWHSPRGAAVRASGVIPGGRTEGCRVVGVESVVCGKLEGSALKRARLAREGTDDERVE